MVTAFLIATLIVFSLNVILNLISLGFIISDGDNKRAISVGASVLIYLIFVTWNIFALVYS
jgi:hypothetical protein